MKGEGSNLPGESVLFTIFDLYYNIPHCRHFKYVQLKGALKVKINISNFDYALHHVCSISQAEVTEANKKLFHIRKPLY